MGLDLKIKCQFLGNEIQSSNNKDRSNASDNKTSKPIIPSNISEFSATNHSGMDVVNSKSKTTGIGLDSNGSNKLGKTNGSLLLCFVEVCSTECVSLNSVPPCSKSCEQMAQVSDYSLF